MPGIQCLNEIKRILLLHTNRIVDDVASAALAAIVLAVIGSAPVPAAPAGAAEPSAVAAATAEPSAAAAAAAATAASAAAETTGDDAHEASSSARVLGEAHGDRRQQRQ